MNVLGDSYGAAIVHHLIRDDLAAIDKEHNARKNNNADDIEFQDGPKSPGQNTVTSFVLEEDKEGGYTNKGIINAYSE